MADKATAPKKTKKEMETKRSGTKGGGWVGCEVVGKGR